MKFTPADNYKDLRVQARALATLVTSMEQQLTLANTQVRDLKKQLALRSDSELQAERETNEKLTKQLEELKRLEGQSDYRAMCAELAEALDAAKCPDPNCDQDGKTGRIIEIVVPGCCGRPLPNGECCGNAVPTPAQDVVIEPCEWCAARSAALNKYRKREEGND